MKTPSLISFCLLLSAVAHSQQKLLSATIEVKDIRSGKAVTAGVATSFPSGKFFEINKGKLELQYQQKMLTDTLFVDVQGYAKYKTTFTELLKQRKLQLTVAQTPTAIQAPNLNKNEQLNPFNNTTVLHWVGLPLNDQPFRYLQVGQIFENTHQGATLTKIKLNQLLFNTEFIGISADGSIDSGAPSMVTKEKPTQTTIANLAVDTSGSSKRNFLAFTGTTYDFYPSNAIFQESPDKGFMRSYVPSDLQSNKFKLRIYQVNEKNQPITELFTNPIVVNHAQPVENMHINLSKYKISLPEGKFMIAVEWMPIRQTLSTPHGQKLVMI